MRSFPVEMRNKRTNGTNSLDAAQEVARDQNPSDSGTRLQRMQATHCCYYTLAPQLLGTRHYGIQAIYHIALLAFKG